MGNRNMAAKAAKLKRQKRLFPRNFSSDYVAVGRGDRGTEDHWLVRENRERAKSLAFDAEYWDKKRPARFKGIAPGRLEARDAAISIYEEAQRSLLQQVDRIRAVAPTLIYFSILDTRVHRARVFRNAESTAFIILYENFKEGVIKTSMTYQFRKSIIDDFHNNRITWVEYRSVVPTYRQDD